MTPQQAIDHYGSRGALRVACALKSEAAIYLWVKQGFIPYDKQCQIQVDSEGKLEASWLDIPSEKRPEGWDRVAA